jgi:hypothetical protein
MKGRCSWHQNLVHSALAIAMVLVGIHMWRLTFAKQAYAQEHFPDPTPWIETKTALGQEIGLELTSKNNESNSEYYEHKSENDEGFSEGYRNGEETTEENCNRNEYNEETTEKLTEIPSEAEWNNETAEIGNSARELGYGSSMGVENTTAEQANRLAENYKKK